MKKYLYTTFICLFVLIATLFAYEKYSKIEVSKVYYKDIPIIWAAPKNKEQKKLIIWLNGLSGNKETMKPYLIELAKRGYFAVSFDAFEHGERGNETQREILTRALNNIQQDLWPILGNSVQDSITVIDWAVKKFNIKDNSICMGGFSMGGDISIAVAGLDSRVRCVAALVATPDWLREGMKDFDAPPKTLGQGHASPQSQNFYDQMNPSTNLQNFSNNRPAITFEMGGLDIHVPSGAARSFRKNLIQKYGYSEDNIQVVVHEKVKHEISEQMWKNSLIWFDKYSEK